MTKVVLLPSPLVAVPPEWPEMLSREFDGIVVELPTGEREATEALRSADVAYGTITPSMFSPDLPLRLLQSPMANPPEGFLFPELVEHPLVVSRMAGIYDDHIATHVMGYILAFARCFDVYARLQTRHEWRHATTNESVVHLPDATVLVVGVGGVAVTLAAQCRAFGTRVIGVDVRPIDPPLGMSFVAPADDLDKLLPEADFVVVTVPGVASTKGLFDRRRFSLMKPTARLINIGRGSTVQLDDLVDALLAGELAGAGLDVAEVEPLPADHAIWDIDGVIITPHMAVQGPYMNDRRFDRLVENIRRLEAGQPFVHVMNKTLGF